jgi:hypothetical protein
MTIPRGIHESVRKVSDLVREMFPSKRNPLSADEQNLAIYLRGNESMYAALSNIVTSRIRGRATVPEPTDPVMCKSMIARDRELQWLLSRLDTVYRSPAAGADDGEQPA